MVPQSMPSPPHSSVLSQFNSCGSTCQAHRTCHSRLLAFNNCPKKLQLLQAPVMRSIAAN